MRESDWQTTVVDTAAALQWIGYHTHDSRRSDKGWPDVAFARDRLVVAELKVGAPVTHEQVVWLDALSRAGVECYLWRPPDFDEVQGVLRTRWRFVVLADRDGGTVRGLTLREHTDDVLPAADLVEYWRPASMWIPGQGRADGT